MITGLIGRKIDQTQGFLENGTRVPLSIISVANNVVTQIITDTLDGAQALGVAFKEINTRRRFDIKPSLDWEYKGICSHNVPVTEFLFGDNLVESLKSTKSVAGVMKSVVSEKRFQSRPSPYNFNNNNNFRGNLNQRRPLPHQPHQQQQHHRGGGHQSGFRGNKFRQGRFQQHQH